MPLERLVEPCQHVVERVCQVAQFIGGTSEVDPPRQVRRRDVTRHRRDPGYRSQDQARHVPPDSEAAEEQGYERCERLRPQPVQGAAVDLFLEGHEPCHPRPFVGHDLRAVTRIVGDEVSVAGLARHRFVGQGPRQAEVDAADPHRRQAEQQD